MAKEFVCVPVSAEQVRRLVAGEQLVDVQVFRVDESLMDSFGLGPADDEEADRAAMLMASLWALSRHGRRLVLTAFVPDELVTDGAETANGGAVARRVRARDVEALFTDEPAAQQAVARARDGIPPDSSVDEMWDHPQVQGLLNHHELLWHTLDEAAQVLAQPS